MVVRSCPRSISLFLAALAVALAWSGTAASGTQPASTRAASERGIVQSVSAAGLVLKTLDGRTIAVAVDSHTRVLVDGKAASILDVRPSFVAVVTLRGSSGKPALEVEAFSTSTPAASKPSVGIVRSAGHNELVLTLGASRLTAVVDASTRVVVDDKPASILKVHAGFFAVVRTRPAKDGDSKKTSVLSELFAFSPPHRTADHLYRGTVATVTAKSITLRLDGGGTVKFAITAKTLVFVNGARGPAGRVKPGFVAVARTGPQRELWAFGALPPA